MNKRAFLLALAALPAWRALAAAPLGAARPVAPVTFAPVLPGRTLVFPRDHGAHPDFRTEWWYATGWLQLPDGSPVGFQTTFFRVRSGAGEGNPSSFAPRQLILAHAAIADPRLGRLRHDQRAARVLGGANAGSAGGAHYSSARTDVHLGDWSFRQEDDSGRRYRAEVTAERFSYALTLVAEAPPMLNGEGGFSRKAADPKHASYYYSRPQLKVSGTLGLDGRTLPVTGRAWLDHEWSSELLPEAAQGWDWIGINFDDGSALMAFRLRGREGQMPAAPGGVALAASQVSSGKKAKAGLAGGQAENSAEVSSAPQAGAQAHAGVHADTASQIQAETLWSAGTLRHADAAVEVLPPQAVAFTALRRWRSPRTGVDYPVEWQVRIGRRRLHLQPLIDDQELDSRRSTGALYWEGAVRVSEDGREIGRGYLEMTGYREKIKVG
ncbi:carotenoid 1,2-hydratase [Rhodocyclus tenuis]|uniref:Carotenoid 1,2-hydratase n=1 Tax=Rhodocyclus gracilis TaxID=2929842 RepID=A0ABX0WDZ8_9RHOO|nr:lipocalin-like domain-containing protein [Rhodocyclus gracilis]NJA87957.1 carotenoid 1,2-hydratase [Rhodocyclus gracilis]